ncbi:translation initiation factor IF-6 [Candidatus Micrarchaeota archaeon]|nr:translation initiation factor IF-6 [Candidatus Micrarchaeota archaeon]
MPEISKASFFNNPFVGLFFKTSDRLAILPSTAPPKVEEQVASTLGAKPVKLFVDNSPLLGIFCVMNSNGAVVSSSASQDELSVLKAEGLNVAVLDRLSPSNNILANDNAALASPHMGLSQIRAVQDALGVEVVQQRISNHSLLAPTTVVTNRGLLAYNDLTETELRQLERIFRVRGAVGTSNAGTIYNALGVVANSKGAVVGMATTGFESQRIYEALFG